MNQLYHIHSTPFQHLGQIYQVIYNKGPISKKKLIELSQLKQTTITRYLKELIDKNLIQEHYRESTGGRPPAFYQINSSYHYIVGIEISRTQSKVNIVNLALDIIDQYSFSMTKQHTPEKTIQLIIQIVTELLSKHQISTKHLLGIGIGAVGPLDRKNGVILSPERFLANGWENVWIVKTLQDAFPEQVILLENGANTAALAEYFKSSKQHQNILYCISGIGLRCGVLTNGQIIQNQTGDASSFGQMIINSDYTRDNPRHSLAMSLSLDTILKEINKRKQSTILESFFEELNRDTIDLIVSSLNEGDTIVNEVVMDSAYYYGVGLANMINILHPEQVILNSTLMYEFSPYYEKVVETAKKYTYQFNHKNIHFSKGNLKSDAVSIGAAAFVLDSLFDLIN